ncbi:MAG TPA: DUF6493 family protein [Prevotella sp.]
MEGMTITQLIDRYTKLAKSYIDTPQNRSEILLPYYKELAALPATERKKLKKTSDDLLWNTKETKWGIQTIACSYNRSVFLRITRLAILDSQSANVFWGRSVTFDLLCEALTIYTPSWFTKIVNTEGAGNFNYFECLELLRRGFISELKPEVIAFKLGMLLRVTAERDTKNQVFIYNNRCFMTDEILDGHLWLLFEYNSTIAWIDKLAKETVARGYQDTDNSLMALLVECCNSGRIDRRRLIQTLLQSLLKGLSAEMNTWFFDILEALSLRTEELVAEQDAILKLLEAPHLKSLLPPLKALKSIAGSPEFHYDRYVEATLPLLYSAPQNAITAICSTYELIAKAHTDVHETLCKNICQLFLNKKEAVQMRGAKFIAKYGNPQSEELTAEIALYEPQMWRDARTALAAFMQPQTPLSEPEEPFVPQAPDKLCTEATRIAPIENKDDFIFAFSRLPDMQDSAEIWSTIGAAVTWYRQLEAQDLDRFESVFERALQFDAPFAEYVPMVLSAFVLEFGTLLEQRHALKKGGIKGLLADVKTTFSHQKSLKGRTYTPLALLPLDSTDSMICGVRNLLMEVIKLLKAEHAVHMLSVPTHQPCYIDALTLVDRLAVYEEVGEKPYAMDLQLAIARCAMDNREPALKAAKAQLKGELRRLMLFLLDEKEEPCGPFTLQTAWVQAGLVKNPDTEYPQFSGFLLNLKPHNFLNGTHTLPSDYQPKPEQKTVFLNRSRQHLKLTYKPRLWQEFLNGTAVWYVDAAYANIQASLLPNRPEPFLALCLEDCTHLASANKTETRVVSAALNMLMWHRMPLRDMDYFFIAAMLVYANPTVRALAGELWALKVGQGVLCSGSIGETLARLLHFKLFPLSRLTQLIAESLLHRSAHHDAELCLLMQPVVAEIARSKPVGGKAFVSMYKELAAAKQG